MKRGSRPWTCLILAMALVQAACARAPQATATTAAAPPATAAKTDRVSAAPTGTGGQNAGRHADAPYVILMSFDGFRADFLDRFDLPAFRRLVEAGARARSLEPVFPTKTFPNHYSLATGLTAERHGIVANTFFDPLRGASYGNAFPGTVNDGSWYRGEPIWVTAETQGMVAATAVWLGSEAVIGGVRPSHWKRIEDWESPEVRVDAILGWLRLPPERRPHVVAMYLPEVDNAGHEAGPDSPEVERAAQLADRAVARLLDGIRSSGIAERSVVVLVSDHGLAVTGPEHYLALEDLADLSGVRVADFGPNANLHTRDGGHARALRDSINARLPHGRAFLRADVPERYRYRTDPRIGDVVIVMDEPYQVGPRARAPRKSVGQHGWDPSSAAMRGIFVAAGPGLPRGVVIPPVRSVDVYPFVCELLGLTPAAGIDGEAGRIRAAIRDATGAAPVSRQAGRAT